jgi:hypothetical protein
MRRELWETLVDLMSAIHPDELADYDLRVNDVFLDLPIEVTVRHSENSFRLFVDLPQWRWQGGYQMQPGRMIVRLQEERYDQL